MIRWIQKKLGVGKYAPRQESNQTNTHDEYVRQGVQGLLTDANAMRQNQNF